MENSSSIFSSEEAGEAKVSKFEDKLLVEENIFGFDISVSIAFGVHVIKSVHHLVEVGSSDDFREFASVGDEVEEFSSSDVFQNDSKAFVSRFILFFVGGVFPHVDKLDEVFVVKVFHDVEFVLEDRETGGLFFVFFDGDKIAVLILTEFDSEIRTKVTVHGNRRQGS